MGLRARIGGEEMSDELLMLLLDENSARGIERQELQGQSDFVGGDTLPKSIRGATREDLVSLGFKFGDDVDELFVHCSLPTGWTKRATEHSMHSELFDAYGRIRAGVFYKAAHYDRRAWVQMLPRFQINAFLPSRSDQESRRCAVTDGGREVFCAGECKETAYKESHGLEDKCAAWLRLNYPDWKNPLAYWDGRLDAR